MAAWADRTLRLPAEYAAEPGAWRSDRYPYQRGILDAATDPQTWRAVLMTSSQVGKSSVVDAIAGYFVDQDPAPVLWVLPTLEMAEGYSKGRLAPLIAATPALARRIGEARSRDSANALRFKAFPGGFIVLAGANSAASLQSRPIRVVLLDEVDQYPPTVDTQGDPVSLAVQRTARFWNRLVILAGTPTVKGASRLEQAFAESDQRRFVVPCPSCDTAQALTWQHVAWEDGEPATAAIRCEACAARWNDRARLAAIRRGQWQATAPFTGTAGFHVWEAYAAPRLAPLVAEFLEQKKQRTTLQTFVNLRLGELWEQDEGTALAWEALRARAEDYAPGTIPDPKVALVTAGVDVQADRLAVLLVGWAIGEEAWILAWEEIFGDPATDTVWRELDTALAWTAPTETGGTLGVACAAIDAGYATQAVYHYVRHHAPRVIAVKGQAGAGRPVLHRPSRQDVSWSGRTIAAGVQLWPVGVDTAKAELMHRLALPIPGPRSVHSPQALTADFYEQLTAERQVTRYTRGVARLEWIKAAGKRNEALDCAVYAYAAAHRAGLARFTAGTWQALAAQAQTPAAPASAPPGVAQPPIRRLRARFVL